MFYDAREDASPSPKPPSDSNRESQIHDFDEEGSISNYSDLLYPELQSTTTASQPSPRLSIDVHGPPPRRRVSSFNSQEGPESPVEFATITGVSPVMPVFPETEINPILPPQLQHSRNGRSKKLAFEEGRRDSFIDFDPPANGNNAQPAAVRTKPSMPDEMPIFTVRHAIQSQNRSLGDYKTLVDEVEARRPDFDLESPTEPRQVLVDGSDKRKAATPTPDLANPLPPTSNLLEPQERKERLKQTRKIVQMLGPTAIPAAQASPRAMSASPHRFTRSDSLPTESLNVQALRENRHQGDEERSTTTTHVLVSKSSWGPLNQSTIFLNANGRRHSSPLSPTLHDPEYYQSRDAETASLSSLGSIIEPADDKQTHTPRSGSPTSFIELWWEEDEGGMRTPKRRLSVERVIVSDMESQDQHLDRGASASGTTEISGMAPLQSKNHFISSESISDDEGHRQKGDWKDEEWQQERQRKRQQLAKIHRYLGSKVPAELVTGFSSATMEKMMVPPVPAVRPRATDNGPVSNVKEWQKRRRSSSAAQMEAGDRRGRPAPVRNLSETLSSSEKMAIIKRAQKIEQIFGEQPTRPLSMSRASPTTDAQFTRQEPKSAPIKPIMEYPVTNPKTNGYKAGSPFPKKDGRPSTAGSSRPSTAQSTTGLLSAYSKDVERERRARQKPIIIEVEQTQTVDIYPSPFPIGTALGSPWEDMYEDVIDISAANQPTQPSKAAVLPGVPTSRQFLDYRTSLNSLGRILDQDDRQSLNELHAVLDNSDDEDEAENGLHGNLHHRRPQLSSTNDKNAIVDPRPERTIQYRASLASINTIASTSTYATLTPEPMTFQARRKRAAKLAHFFGASYRDLFGEVLDRIERGMLEEATRGEMSQEEVKHLMKQLDKLKKRHSQLD